MQGQFTLKAAAAAALLAGLGLSASAADQELIKQKRYFERVTADRQARPERQGTLPECDATRLRSLRLLQRRVVWSGKVDPCERKRRDQQDRAPVEVSHRHPACYRGFVAAGAHRSRAGRVGLVTNPLPPLRRRYATTCDVPAVPRNWHPPPGEAQARQPSSDASCNDNS